MKRLLAWILGMLLLCPPACAERLPDDVLLSYYDDCLFIGDSIMQGFVRYRSETRVTDPDFLEELTVVCTSSISLYTASRHVMDNNSYFLFRGRKCTMYDIARALKPKRLFILLGLNDPVGVKIDKAMKWIEYIVESMPYYSQDTEVCFFSHTPVTETYCQTRKREGYQDQINEYNRRLQEACEKLGATYVEIAEPFKDADGYLAAAYTSDNICHLNDDGIALWIQTLQDYAQEQYDAGAWTPGVEAKRVEAAESLNEQKGTAPSATAKTDTETNPLRSRVWAVLADPDDLVRLFPEDLENRTGIDRDDYTDYAFFESKEPGDGREVIVLTAADGKDADRIEVLLRRYLNRRMAESRKNRPGAIALRSGTEVIRSGLTVMLAGSEDADAIAQLLEAGE